MVRIPIAENSALYYIKHNDSLSAFAYKWRDKKSLTKYFNGDIFILPYQTGDAKILHYKNGILNVEDGFNLSLANASIISKQRVQSLRLLIERFWCWLNGDDWDSSAVRGDGSGEVGRCFPSGEHEPSGGGGAGAGGAGGESSGDGSDYGSYWGSAGAGASYSDPTDIGGGLLVGGVGYGGGSAWIEYSQPSPITGGCGPNGDQFQDPGTGCSLGNNNWESIQINYNENAAYTLIDRLGITEVSKRNFLLNNGIIAHELFNYLQSNGNNSSTISLLIWSVDYLYANPTVAINVFKNQFLVAPEGEDGDYDAAFWDDPNLTFPQQALPTYQTFSNAYPSHNDPLYNTAEKVFTLIGGAPLSIYTANPRLNSNTCATRLSRALNYSGVVIPNITGKTYKGSDNKYYFLGAANMISWMKKTFGVPTGSNHITHADAGVGSQNVVTLLQNKKGIYGLIPMDSSRATGFDATGHIDLIMNAVCDGGCYFNPRGGGIKDIYI